MRYIQLLAATTGLLVVAGMTDPALAERGSVSLFTPVTHSGEFDCNVLNTSNKTLNITISIIDLNGHALAVSPPTRTAPGTEASNSFGNPTEGDDAYCKVDASGTTDRNDLRVVLNVQLIKTFDEGSRTNIPVFVFRSLPGY